MTTPAMEPQDRSSAGTPAGAAGAPSPSASMPVIRTDPASLGDPFAAPPPPLPMPAAPLPGSPSDAVANRPGAPLAQQGPGQPGALAPRAGRESVGAVFGDVKRDGMWTVPADLTIYTGFGDATLDFREARFSTTDPTVSLKGAFGDLKVIVPPGVDVDITGVMVFGDQQIDRGSTPAPSSGLRVHIDTFCVFGDVTVFTLPVGAPIPSWWERFKSKRNIKKNKKKAITDGRGTGSAS